MALLSDIQTAISGTIAVYKFILSYRIADKEVQDLSSDVLALLAVLDSLASVCEITHNSTSLGALKIASDSCLKCLDTLLDQLPDSVKQRISQKKSDASVFQKIKFAGFQKKGLEEFRRSLLECKATLNIALSKTQLHETSNRLKRIQDSLELNSAEIRQSQDNIRQDIQRLEETIKFQGAESDVSDKAVHSDSDRTDSGAMKTFHLRRRDRLHGFMSSTPAVNDNSLDGENLSREVKLPSMKFIWAVDVLVPNGRRSRDVSAGVDPDLKFSWTDNSFVFSKLKASDQIKRIQDVEDDSFYKGKSQSMFKLRYEQNYYEPEGVVRLWISRHRHFDRVPIDFLVFDSLAPPGEVGLVICSDQLRLTIDAQQSGPATKTSSSYNLNSLGESAQARPSNTRRPSGNPHGTPSSTSASNQHQPPVSQSQSYARDSRSAPSTSTRPQNQQSDAQRYSAGSRRDLPTTPTRTQNQQADPQRHPADSATSRRSIPTTSSRPQNRQPDPQRQPDRFRSNVPSASSTPRQNRQPEKQKHPVRGGYRDNHSSSSTDRSLNRQTLKNARIVAERLGDLPPPIRSGKRTNDTDSVLKGSLPGAGVRVDCQDVEL